MDSNDNEFHEEKSKKTYLIVLASAVTLLAGGAGLWFSGFNLFGLGGGDKEKEVGKLENETGKTRREQASEQAFQEITKDSLLYNQDTVITAENAEATLLLNDGSRLEMAPGTMIKLNFDSSVSLGGVSRTLNVQILSGEVSGTPAEHSSPKTKIILSGAGKNVELTQPRQTLQVSKPKPTATPTPVQTPSPSPSPSPTFSPTPTPIVHTGVIIAPTNGTHLKVEDGKNAPIVPVVFEWRVTPEIGITYFYLNRFADESGKTQKILKKGVKGSSFPVDLKLPGHYQWGIGDATDQHLYAKADFYVDPDYRAIQLLAPTVGGAATTSSAIQDKLLTQFDIQLQWKPYDVPAFPGKEYVVSVFSDANSPEAVFQRSLSNGFTAHSPREEFIFEFIAPLPVLPEDKATVSTATLTNKDHSLLFTWQKTNFTDNYHFQLAKDADFKTVILNTTGKSNFFFLKSPKPGTYFWRVESMAGQMKSGPSPASQLTVTP